MANKANRINVTLKCTECGEHNYITTRNKKNTPGKLEIRKYCKVCRKETVHKEAK